jgi:Family of unknown function (DUF5677)
MDEGISVDELWPDAYAPKWEVLTNPESESYFGEASFELLKEAGTLTHLSAGLLPESTQTRDEAILCALVLKASKLSKAVIAMTAHLGGDRQIALVRELVEALATLHYLLHDDGSGDRFDRYVQDSLVSEREFLRTITSNIKKRQATLEIEKSMTRSIERTAAAAGIDDVNSLPARSRIGWPNAEELLKELGENLYPAYRSGSSVLHTKWHDLVSHHLIHKDDGTFELRFDDTQPRPQPLYAGGLLLVVVTREYLAKLRPDALKEKFGPRLDDLESRLQRVVELHNSWLDEPDAAD